MEKRFADADCVVQGKIVGVESFWTKLWNMYPSYAGTSVDVEKRDKQVPVIASIVTVTVERQIKPCGATAKIGFQVGGGHVGRVLSDFPAGHKYDVGREVVLFLKKLPRVSNLTKYAKEKDFGYLLSGYDSLYYVERNNGKVALLEAFSGKRLGKTEDNQEVPLKRLEDLSGQ